MAAETLLTVLVGVRIVQHVVRADQLVVMCRKDDLAISSGLLAPLHDFQNDGRCQLVVEVVQVTPDFLDVLEEGFKEFFEKEVPGNPLKAEYLIPIFIGELLEQGKMSVKVLKTNDTWYGMTYVDVPREDGERLEEDPVAKREDSIYLFDKHRDVTATATSRHKPHYPLISLIRNFCCR